MKILIFISFLLGLASCVSVDNTQNQVRETSSVRGTAPSPCRESRDCASGLICRKGACLVPDAKKEAYEPCMVYSECRSLRCDLNVCVPSQAAPANNGEPCYAQIPTNCRSGACDTNGLCRGSMRFPAFPGVSCDIDTDCISQICGTDKTCKAGQDSLTCKSVSAPCIRDQECCSQACSQNRCLGKSVNQCQNQSCGQTTGKVCATTGQVVRFETECCSLRMMNNRCLPTQNGISHCLTNFDCGSGFRCDSRQKICVPD